MREILFRAKRIDNGEWVEGWYEPPVEGTHCDGRKERLGASLAFIGEDGFLEDAYIIPETVGQFTGLTDKNGKKIFENDIVVICYEADGEHFSETKRVHYNEKECCWYPMRWDECCEYCDHYTEVKSIEVIGNIHDNPELLKGERENDYA